MRKLLFLLPILLTACISPSPEASAPVNIRVICGEKEEPKIVTEPSPNITLPSVSPDEYNRFWKLVPGNETEPMCCGQPWPGGTHDSTCTMICPDTGGNTLELN